MSRKVAIFGGSFNPAAGHHRRIAKTFPGVFEKGVVVPCGPRPDKATTNDIDPVHRAIIADLTFRDIPGVEVDLFDLEHATFTRTHALDAMYAAKEPGEIFHVVGADLIKGGKDGRSRIQAQWFKGEELWRRCNFAVVPREGYPLEDADLPPNRIVLPASPSGSSSDIRTLIYQHKPYRGLVTDAAAEHIERYNLYRGGLPVRTTRLRLPEPRGILVLDERNPKAVALAARLSGYAADEASANCVIAIGGDGTMLRAIRRHWRKRLPFVGLNTGHKGWLLNDVDELADPAYLFDEMSVQLMPQLYVEFARPDGTREGRYAFNDAWVERSTGQCAWLEAKVGDRAVRKLVADGVLVCTAAGSTAYARAMGATPLIDEAESCLLVGSNVMEPRGWKTAPFSFRTTVELTSLDPAKRPVRGFVDGKDVGEVVSMIARVSRIASVELCFSPARDRAAKIAEELFPG